MPSAHTGRSLRKDDSHRHPADVLGDRAALAVEEIARRALTGRNGARLRRALGENLVGPDECVCGWIHAAMAALVAMAARHRGFSEEIAAFESGPSSLNGDGFSIPSATTFADWKVAADVLDDACRADDVEWRSVVPESLGGVYERLLAERFQFDPASKRIEPGGGSKSRKAAGAYYTPPDLVDCLLDAALEPALDEAVRSPDPESALLALRVCDPACGTGNFLVAAARRMAARLARLREPSPSAGSVASAFGDVARSCLHGVDLDPTAVLVCRAILVLTAALPLAAESPRGPLDVGDGRIRPQECGRAVPVDRRNLPRAVATRIRCGDSLLDGLLPVESLAVRDPTSLRNGRVGGLDSGFDVVLGNPPFVNAIEGPVDRLSRRRLKERFPELGGTADRAFAFLALSARIARPGGRVGLVQPRTVLNAPAAAGLRRRLLAELPPRLVFVCDRPDLFRGASVFVSLIALGPPGDVRVARGDSPQTARWRTGAITEGNWWAATLDILENRSRVAARVLSSAGQVDGSGPVPTVRVGDEFEVAAGMTAGDAYDVLPFVVDDCECDGPMLVTTGLIDPGTCLWGQRRCRFLRRDFTFPRVVAGDGLSASLKRRVAGARRPKVLVAGLSRRIECFLDADGTRIGAVSTWSITHPRNDVRRLAQLEHALLSDAATAEFRRQLGGNALGGGNTTVTRAFLQSLWLRLTPDRA